MVESHDYNDTNNNNDPVVYKLQSLATNKVFSKDLGVRAKQGSKVALSAYDAVYL